MEDIEGTERVSDAKMEILETEGRTSEMMRPDGSSVFGMLSSLLEGAPGCASVGGMMGDCSWRLPLLEARLKREEHGCAWLAARMLKVTGMMAEMVRMMSRTSGDGKCSGLRLLMMLLMRTLPAEGSLLTSTAYPGDFPLDSRLCI